MDVWCRQKCRVKSPSKKKIFLYGCMVQAEVLRKDPSKKKIFLYGCMVLAEVLRKGPSKKNFLCTDVGAAKSPVRSRSGVW